MIDNLEEVVDVTACRFCSAPKGKRCRSGDGPLDEPHLGEERIPHRTRIAQAWAIQQRHAQREALTAMDRTPEVGDAVTVTGRVVAVDEETVTIAPAVVTPTPRENRPNLTPVPNRPTEEA